MENGDLKFKDASQFLYQEMLRSHLKSPISNFHFPFSNSPG
jgi:hypothetical protein